MIILNEPEVHPLPPREDDGVGIEVDDIVSFSTGDWEIGEETHVGRVEATVGDARVKVRITEGPMTGKAFSVPVNCLTVIALGSEPS